MEIAHTADFEKHLNQYNVIFLSMQDFLSRASNSREMTELLDRRVSEELKEVYKPDNLENIGGLPDLLDQLYADRKVYYYH